MNRANRYALARMAKSLVLIRERLAAVGVDELDFGDEDRAEAVGEAHDAIENAIRCIARARR